MFFKLILHIGIIGVRILQILAAFHREDFWLYERPYTSLLYLQFVAGHSVSMCLLLH
jgi:hypothetical protein